MLDADPPCYSHTLLCVCLGNLCLPSLIVAVKRVLDADPRVIHTHFCEFVWLIFAFPALIVAVKRVLDADPRAIHTHFYVFSCEIIA